MPLPGIRSLVIVSAVVVAGMGALHLPIARPLLARLGVPCPVDNVSTVQVETMHRAAVDALRGTAAAPTLDIFGLTILATRQSDTGPWANARQMNCQSLIRGMHYLACTNVAAAAIGGGLADEAIDDLTLSFDSSGLLVGIDALRGGMTNDRAAALGESLSLRLHRTFGTPTEQAGQFSAAHLGQQAFATSYIKYQFTNYLVMLTAVQMPGRGVTVREQYVGIPAAVERES